MRDANFQGLHGKRCLVIGADGFLGRALCRAAMSHGAIVSGFGRRRPDASTHVDWRRGSFTDKQAVAEALKGQDFVFHLLGSGTPARALKDQDCGLDEGIKLSVDMLDLLRDCPATTLLFASSGGAIYGVTDRVAVREDHALTPISSYGADKLILERHLDFYHRAYGLTYRTLRISNAFGPNQASTGGQGFVAAAIRATLAERALEVWGNGGVVRDYVYVGDVARAFLLAALYDGEATTFNVGSGHGRSLNEVLCDVAAVLGRLCEVNYSYERAIDVPWNVLDVGLIEAEMGWRPVTGWRMGLDRAADWLRASEAR